MSTSPAPGPAPAPQSPAPGPAPAADAARLAEFTGLRPLLFAVAYRMLGAASGAEDALQEAWLRYAQAADVEQPRAYLVQVVTRLCVDQLRSAHARRVAYVGPWLPEPVLTGGSVADDPLAAVERRERLSLGALALLEQLSPAERAVLVLREGLAYSHADIAAAVGVSAAASRQLLSRARRRLAAGPPRQDVDPAAHCRLLDALVAAFSSGDTAGLVALLRADVALVSDGGGEVRAALRVVSGRDKVSRLLLALWPALPAGALVEPVEANGLPGLGVRLGAELRYLVGLDVRDGAVDRLYLVAAPSKLRYAARQLPGSEALARPAASERPEH